MLVLVLALMACRTIDLISNARQPQPTPTTINTPRPTHPPIKSSLNQYTPTEAPIVESPLPSVQQQPTQIPPTSPSEPTSVPRSTRRPAVVQPTLKPAATDAPTTGATSAPARCPFPYCAVNRGCQPEEGNLIIEGTVYRNGEPESGVAVRAAKNPGEAGIIEDFLSGTETINPGKLDPKHPGKYVLQIMPGKAEKGDWWVFLVDQKGGTKQISEPVLVHTTADPFQGNSCQHAFVDFVR